METRKLNILVGVSGSVAAIKLPSLKQELKKKFRGCVIKIVATQSGLVFINKTRNCTDSDYIYTEKDEWKWEKKGDSVLHIYLRNWADLLIIAPLSANTLAKISNGICDNLLTCIVRAWDRSKRLVVCPAMNTAMWQHPFTGKQLQICRELGYTVIDPINKLLACGDEGIGAMEEPSKIVDFLFSLGLDPPNYYQGSKYNVGA